MNMFGIILISLLSSCVAEITHEFKHIGCFFNTSEITMSKKHISEDMTLSLCHETCKDFEEDYMILSSGNTCYCGNSQFEPVDDCSFLCEGGEEEETCGGENSVDVYRMNKDGNENTNGGDDDVSEYMDCFSDKEEERIMDYFVVIEDLTTEKCRLHCSSIRNSMYYATQNGNECFCGTSNIFSDYDIHGKGVCDSECKGDPDDFCGGFFAFDLYRFIPCGEDEPVEKTVKETDEPVEKTDDPVEKTVKETDEPVEKTVEKTDEPVEKTDEPVEKTEKPVEPEPEPVDMDRDPKIEVGIGGELETEEEEVTDPNVDAGNLEEEVTDPNVDAGNFKELLDLHNLVRCEHDTGPLKWSSDVAASAQKYADKLSSSKCGKLEHSRPEERNNYGENLYISGNTVGNSYSAEKAMMGWYTEETTPDNTDVESFQGHATQILWSSTTELGCGLAQCESNFKFDLVVCQYQTAGNNMAKLLDEVKPFKNEC